MPAARPLGYNAGIADDTHPAPPRRTRSRTGRALRYAAVTGAIGAAAVFASFYAAERSGDAHWSLRTISWIVFGGCFGAVFGPLFALARETDVGDEAPRAVDGELVHGQSDTSTEGAQAHDMRRGRP
ncbi:MAG TPA: hypothetical protein VGF46_09745 [Gaiellales bacterium]